MKNIKNGIGGSSGIAIAKVFLIDKTAIEIPTHQANQTKQEIEFFQKAMNQSKAQIENIREITLKKLGQEKAAIFDAHIQILEDPSIVEDIENKIKNEKQNAAFAINEAYLSSKAIFEQMEDAYFKERAADIGDVRTRILSNLLNIEMPDILAINSEVIIVAEDLTPSETALLDKKFVKGFLVDAGGRTSHAAIMARTMEIPAILALKDITKLVNNGDMVAMNGDTGVVEINPVDVNAWNEAKQKNENIKLMLKKLANQKAATLDGKQVLVEANIGKPNDVDNLEQYGAEGVGLFRSEFLYMENSKWPTEQEQFEAYKYVLEKQKDHLTVVRTLDIGGDKHLDYYKFDEEMNPFLGYRAIRFCLDNKEVFETQLRALARASVYGQLGIMFPMIATIDEFKKAKAAFLKVIDGLKKENVPVANNIQIGMMIEIPASAVLADQFANHADFFSIGTNDLVQYTFAVDRMSPKVEYLYQPNNPSLLRLVKMTIDGAKGKNTWVGMCGEMAGDIMSLPILLGLGNKGLDAFSMSASTIPKAKYVISKLKSQDCYELANQAIQLETKEQVDQLVLEFFKKNDIDLNEI